jgi:hypothetical protein
VRVRRQSGAFPAVAVAAGALVRARHQRPPPPLPLPHAPVNRAWPQGGSESKWMMSSVPGTPLEYLGQRASCVSRL